MHSSAAEFLAWVETRSPGEAEFHQAVACGNVFGHVQCTSSTWV